MIQELNPIGAEPRVPSPSIEEILACADVGTLCQWYSERDAREVDIRSFLDAFRSAAIDDEHWFKRTAGALAYCTIGKKWIERRILTLGGTPPYSPTDPRSKQLRLLNEKVDKLQRRVAELEAEPGGGDR